MHRYMLGVVAAVSVSLGASAAQGAKLVYDVVFQHYDGTLKINGPGVIPTDDAVSYDISQTFKITLYADLVGGLNSYGAFQFRDDSASFGSSPIDDLIANTLAFNRDASTPVGEVTNLLATSSAGDANIEAHRSFQQYDADLLAGTFNIHAGSFSLYSVYAGAGFSTPAEFTALQLGAPLNAVFQGQVGISGFDTFGGRFEITRTERYTGLAYLNPDDTDLSFSAVPEPAAWAMMIAGLGCAGALLRRRLPARGHVRDGLVPMARTRRLV